MSGYYDRRGQPIDMITWARTFQDRVVAQHWVRGWMVSTVWLGLDHGWGGGPPLIFETMVFPPGDEAKGGSVWSEEYCERYPAEAAAQAGHDRALKWVVGKLGPESVADITGPLVPDEDAP